MAGRGIGIVTGHEAKGDAMFWSDRMERRKANRHRSRQTPRFAITAILPVAVVSAIACGATPRVYDIETQTSMPHLRENLRYMDHTVRRALDADVNAAYFPILDLHSFSGCLLTSPEVLGVSIMYLLECPGTNGTTGAALIEEHARTIDGVLSVRMGGKNMTFSQRIQARPADNPEQSQDAAVR